MAGTFLRRPVDGQRLAVETKLLNTTGTPVAWEALRAVAAGVREKLEQVREWLSPHAFVVLAQHGDDHVAAAACFTAVVPARSATV